MNIIFLVHHQPEKGWNRSELVRPNIVEMMTSPPAPAATPSPQPPAPRTPQPKQCRYQQLYDLLRDIGLFKYVGQ